MTALSSTLLLLSLAAVPAAPEAPASPPAPAAVAPAGDAGPAGPPLHHWELDLFAGYGQLAWPGIETAGTRWSNGNFAAAATVAYRSPHFTHPFLDISYVPFVSSGQDIYRLDGNGTVYTTASTHGLAFVVGPGFDISWFRVRAGVGACSLTTSTTALGVSTTSSSLQITYLLAAAARVWEADPFSVGVEARLLGLSSPGKGFYQSAWSVGLTGRWDFANH